MDILTFIAGAMILHVGHHFLLWRLKKSYSFNVNGKSKDLFRTNKPYQLTEGCFIMLNVGYASSVPAVLYGDSPHINIITVIAIIIILVGSIQSGIDLNKRGSFFRFSDQYLKWNFALGNSYDRTVKIELKDILCIENRANNLVIYLSNSKKLKIGKSELGLLNGFDVLKERLLSLNPAEEKH